MKFPDTVYNVLKWICLVAIPALDTFLGVLLPTLEVSSDITSKVITIISATGAFMGVLLGVSNAQYTIETNDESK